MSIALNFYSCALIDRDEVELAVEELHRELDQKVSEERLLKVVDNQAALNESLCSENIIGRWAWKSGKQYFYWL